MSRLIFLAALLPAALAAAAVPRELPGTRAAAATLIVQGIEGGSLPFAASAVATSAGLVVSADGVSTLRLTIAFELPAQGLPEAVATAPVLELYVYALTGSGSVAAHRGLAIDLPGGLRAASRAGVRLISTLDLPPGDYALHYLVLEPGSHHFGLRIERVSLPGAAALSRPAIDDRCAAWRVAATPGAPSIVPSALPVLVIGSRVAIETSVRDDPRLALEPGTASVRLVPTSAGEAAEAVSLDASPTGGGAPGLVALTFDLPALARGVYRLSLGLEAGGRTLTSEAIEAWVVDEHDLGTGSADPCARTWSAVLAAAPEAPGRRAESPEPDKRAQRAQRVRLRGAYRDVLETLAATAELERATEALCLLEARRPNLQSGLQALLRNQLEVARRLSAREPEVLAPLMMLHHQAYLEHLRDRRFALAGHSVRAVQALAELTLGRRLSDESRTLASAILTSLAEHGHHNRMLVPSQISLRAAVEMDPGNREALLLLAVNYEWLGRYAEAAELLERLVRIAATHSEARLRLGVVSRRTGDAAAAERQFRRVLREGAEPWLLSLAFQELAGLLHEQGRDAEAVELLRRGRLRLGEDQRLHVLSAHALDRAGRPAEARALLARLPIDGSDRTPRFRYGESLTSALGSLRAHVERGVAVRLPLLARALEEGGR